MLQLLCMIGIFAVVIVNNGTLVESARFCANYTHTSCPSDDQLEFWNPFWIDSRTVDDNGDCVNYPVLQITCEGYKRPVMNISNNFYYVLNSDRFDVTGMFTVTDVVIDAQECPQPRRNFSIGSARFLHHHDNTINMTFFYNCSDYPENVVQHMPCLDDYNNVTGTTGRRSFALIDEEIGRLGLNWSQNCEDTVVVPVTPPNIFLEEPMSMNYTHALKNGFILYWRYPRSCQDCSDSGGECWANETNQAITTPFHCDCQDNTTLVDAPCVAYLTDEPGTFNRLKIIIGVSVGLGVLVLLILLVFYRKSCYTQYDSATSSCRKMIKGPTNVEAFLENNHEGFSLHNYKYSDVKKMTNSFKDALGQGGYGSVFKGKLRDGQSVAVKVLNESKGKGEDFINEVGTIGRTNHVNVVSLLGFCAEGTKRALVYEFMSNGSLEKFVHNAKDSSTASSHLGWEKLYQITLGIARGLEYLHRGCKTRILHFDIKPHNILLDQDFCPKISDFGMAMLCPTRESMVSISGARGTIGYIAPEVFCANFGGVSHKSDVYSYGMMVLEMIGGRNNIDITVENTSEIYFPQWIYKRLRGNIKVEGSEKIEAIVISGVDFEEIAQKMIIVALWCIQPHPGDRPSTTKVVDMLEGDIKNLRFPPNPFPDPSSTSPSP